MCAYNAKLHRVITFGVLGRRVVANVKLLIHI
uniref:Uncharacterized protein n=1 Tax=Anguilla anguilla TaxID=7936 RepID=A0A0E9XI05_ANGAN